MALSISGTSGRYDAYQLLGERIRRRNEPSGESTRPASPGEPRGSGPIAEESDPSRPEGPGGKPLSEAERRMIDDLKKRDRAVRAHEQAHMAAGGTLVRGGPTYQYQTAPDGQRYAVGGEVSIGSAGGKTPEETIARAQAIKAAALAPSDPSGADRAVAAKAAGMEAQARRELQSQGPGRESDAPDHAERREDGRAAPVDAASARPERHSPQADRPGRSAGSDRVPDGRMVRGIATYQATSEPMARSHAHGAGVELLA